MKLQIESQCCHLPNFIRFSSVKMSINQNCSFEKMKHVHIVIKCKYSEPCRENDVKLIFMVLVELSCDSTVNVRMASSTKFYWIVFVCLKQSTFRRGRRSVILI